MGALIVLLAGAVLLAFCASIIAAPRWFARSLHRNRLWHLRDRFVAEIVSGRIPADDPAVRDTLRRIERAIASVKQISLLRALIFARLARRLTPDASRALDRRTAWPSLHRLDAHQQATVTSFREALDTLLAGGALLSSWLGVFLVLMLLPKAWMNVHRRDCDDGTPTRPISIATDDATETTWVGRKAKEAVEDYIMPPYAALTPA